MKKTIQLLLLSILCSSYLLSAQIEEDANTSTTLELAIEQDSLALVALYNSTGGDEWTRKMNWMTDAPLSTWYGVTLDDNGRVSEIDLDTDNLKGVIPPELAELNALVKFNLYGNQLTGSIPIEFGQLVKVKSLVLSRNQLSGTIPIELGELNDLETLRLDGNQLSGSIPGELGKLVNLSNLNLSGNQLSGTIPNELGNLSILSYLRLSGNELSGSIPPEIGKLNNLGELYLSGNQLSGSIPNELGNLNNLYQLKMSYNLLSGKIPSELGSLDKLMVLNLSDNQLSGSIPPEMGNLKRLSNLYLRNNNLNGSIPTEFENLDRLSLLDLSSNQLSGTIPAELGNLRELRWLYLSDNKLTGKIPPELSNLKISLRKLALSNNQFSGTIPSELGDMSHLEHLILDNNYLVGEIPESFLELRGLKELSLNNNELDSGLDNIYTHTYIIDSVCINSNRFDFSDFKDLTDAYNSFFDDFDCDYALQDSLGKQEIIILDEGGEYTLSSSTEHVDGNQYIWFKDGEEIQNETNKELTIIDAQNGDEGIYTCSVTNQIAPLLTLYRRPLTLTFDKSASVNDYIKITNEFKVYPNPARDFVAIEINNPATKSSIQILNLLGSEVLSLDVSNESLINIDISQFTNGYYNIVISTDDKKYFQPLFVNR